MAPRKPSSPPSETTKVGRRGAVVIPAALRRRYGLEEGAPVVAEAVEDGVLLRPAVVVPIRLYSPVRKAEFLLNNAVDAEDYVRALREVRKLGLDPRKIPHRKPPGAK